jgi:hypothetical protein
MSYDSIGKAMMIIYDELKNDKQSKSIIKQIDGAKNDEQVKDGFRKAVKRLRELGKNALADDVQDKTKGYAF